VQQRRRRAERQQAGVAGRRECASLQAAQHTPPPARCQRRPPRCRVAAASAECAYARATMERRQQSAGEVAVFAVIRGER